MENTKKIKNAATVLFAIVSLSLLWFIIRTVEGFMINTAEWHAQSIASIAIGILISAAILIFALMLLYTIKKDESPFNKKNVTRLKIIAVLLVVLEPYLLIAQWVMHKLYPIILNDGTMIESHSSMGGTVIAAGLVVYCVSLVFDYGISLQKQVDETL